MSAPGIQTGELKPSKGNVGTLTAAPTGWPHRNLFFILRKTNPELISAVRPPLFAEEDWP